MATRLITTATALKRADQLVPGDIIPGGNAPKGHEVIDVLTGRIDDMLGLVTIIKVRQVPMDAGSLHSYRTYTFRPFDKVWVEA